MKVQFLGAACTVTGSCYLLETEAHRFLVDAGLFQGCKGIKERNYHPFLFSPAEIDFLFLTHAHIDHSGLIPKLYRYGFRGPIYCTEATADLCSVMLPDSGHIQEMEVERKNRKLSRAGKPLIQPIYTEKDARDCLELFHPLSYNETVVLSDYLTVRFQDIGHILGSSLIEFWVREGEEEIKLVFSGDVGNYNKPLLKDPAVVEAADYLFLESTYGSRLHLHKQDVEEELCEIINRTIARGGNVVIPAFAVERTQDIIYSLNNLVRKRRIPLVPIVIDSPLAIAATEIFRRHIKDMDAETINLLRQGENPLEVPGLQYSLTAEESKSLNNRKGVIIISASGMADAGRIKHHLKHNLWRPECTVVFVGYQAPGTLGHKLISGEKLVTIHGEEVAVKAEICNLEGFSAHADQVNLVKWVKKFRVGPGKIFLVHGEPEACEELGRLIQKETNIPVYIPAWLETVELPPIKTTVQAYAAGSLGGITEAEAKEMQLRIPTEEDLAHIAEKTYFNVRMKLREMVEKDMDSRRFADLMAKLKELEARITALAG